MLAKHFSLFALAAAAPLAAAPLAAAPRVGGVALSGGPFSVHVGGYGPKVEIRIARPTLAWQIWPSDGQTPVRSVSLVLDGNSVAAIYDASLRAVVYRPDAPMATGPHHVGCSVTFENFARFDQNWDFRILPGALSELPTADARQVESLAAANRIRQRLGLEPFVPDDRLNMAAVFHSHYLSVNRETGHEEAPDKPGFLGGNGAARVQAFGWVGGSWEDVNFGPDTIAEAISTLFDAPYHRIPFMLAGRPAFGSGYEDQRFTIDFGDTFEIGTTVSPTDGETGVPREWHDYERPNPMRIHGVDARITGYPIVLAHFGPGPHLRKMFGWLTGPDGRDVPCWLNTPLNDDKLQGAAILIPQQPLRPHSKYRAGFDGRDESNRRVREEVTFTTGD